jgi:hypothetical protein
MESQLHQVLIGFSDLNDTSRVVFTDFTLCSVFAANFCLAMVVSVKFAAWSRLCTVLCETTKQAVNLSVHQDGGRPSAGIPEILEAEASISEISMSCHQE